MREASTVGDEGRENSWVSVHRALRTTGARDREREGGREAEARQDGGRSCSTPLVRHGFGFVARRRGGKAAPSERAEDGGMNGPRVAEELDEKRKGESHRVRASYSVFFTLDVSHLEMSSLKEDL